MARTAPPPDFRYVGLEPGPSARQVALIAAGLGVATFGVGLALGGGAEAGTLLAAGAIGAVTTVLVARLRGPTARGLVARQAPMAIVPWGVLVHSELTPRVLRWAAVRSVEVAFVHEMDHATPATRWSVVTIATERELLGGRVRGGVSLERLEAHLERYAEEAARPVAGDLDGATALDDGLEPGFELLLNQARRLLDTGALSERLSLSPVSYRAARAARPSAEALALLSSALDAGLDAPADPRPLAAVIAAELSATALLDAIADLTTSPHPFVAAVSRAAALRLGADPKRVGALDEVAEFVATSDLERIEAWVSEG